MDEENPTTQEMKARQSRRTEEERRLAEETGEHEAEQHERRADKSAYLERKLAERERSERGSG